MGRNIATLGVNDGLEGLLEGLDILFDRGSLHYVVHNLYQHCLGLLERDVALAPRFHQEIGIPLVELGLDGVEHVLHCLIALRRERGDRDAVLTQPLDCVCVEPCIVHHNEGATWKVPGILLLQLLQLLPNLCNHFVELLGSRSSGRIAFLGLQNEGD